MTDKETMQLALEFSELIWSRVTTSDYIEEKRDALENALLEALARPERKPLTDEQRNKIEKDNTTEGYHGDYYDAYGIIDAVEAAHGIKETE